MLPPKVADVVEHRMIAINMSHIGFKDNVLRSEVYLIKTEGQLETDWSH